MLATAGDLGSFTRQPYTKMETPDGYLYLFNCEFVASIDSFFMTECSLNMTKTAILYAKELIAFEDGLYNKNDIAALDALFVGMVESGQDCNTYQGELSGCV